MENKLLMPVMFIGHGSPMNAISDTPHTQALKKISNELPKPKAILMISAHFETNGTFVTAMEKPKTIHDFYGFPDALFEVEYPAPGSPALAKDISQKIDKSLINLDENKWGLDHGCWAVLRHLFPDANVPTVQLSINRNFSFREHYELGKKLTYLREEGVLIVGSGNIVHNLMEVIWAPGASSHAWATEFDLWVKEKLDQHDFESLIDKPRESSEGKKSIPTPEHYIPLLYILGSSRDGEKVKYDYEGLELGSMSMRTFRFQ